MRTTARSLTAYSPLQTKLDMIHMVKSRINQNTAFAEGIIRRCMSAGDYDFPPASFVFIDTGEREADNQAADSAARLLITLNHYDIHQDVQIQNQYFISQLYRQINYYLNRLRLNSRAEYTELNRVYKQLRNFKTDTGWVKTERKRTEILDRQLEKVLLSAEKREAERRHMRRLDQERLLNRDIKSRQGQMNGLSVPFYRMAGLVMQSSKVSDYKTIWKQSVNRQYAPEARKFLDYLKHMDVSERKSILKILGEEEKALYGKLRKMKADQWRNFAGQMAERLEKSMQPFGQISGRAPAYRLASAENAVSAEDMVLAENTVAAGVYLSLKDEFVRLIEQTEDAEEVEKIWNWADSDAALRESAKEWKKHETKSLPEKKQLLKEWIGQMDGWIWERFLTLFSVKKELEKLTEKSFQYSQLVGNGLKEKTAGGTEDRGETAAEAVLEGIVDEPADRGALETERFVEQMLENEQAAVMEYLRQGRLSNADFVEQEEVSRVFIEQFLGKEYTEKEAVKPENWFAFVERLHSATPLEEEFYSYFHKNKESFPHSGAGNEEGNVKESKKENDEYTRGYLALKNEFFRLVESSKEPEELEQIWNLANSDHILRESAGEWKNRKTETLSEKKERLKEWIGYMDGVSWERFLHLLSVKKELEKLTEKSFRYSMVKTGIQEETVREPADRGKPAAAKTASEGSVDEPVGHRGSESEPFSEQFVEQILESEQQAVMEYLRHGHPGQEQFRQEYPNQGDSVEVQLRQGYPKQGDSAQGQRRQEYSNQGGSVEVQRRQEYPNQGQLRSADFVEQEEPGHIFIEEFLGKEYTEKGTVKPETWFPFVERLHSGTPLEEEFYNYFQKNEEDFLRSEERNEEGNEEENKKENEEHTHGYLALKNEFFRLIEGSKEPEELEQIWDLADLDYDLKESAREWRSSETETFSEKKELLKEWIGYMDGASWERFLILLSTKKKLEKLTEKSFRYSRMVGTEITGETVSEPADRIEPPAVKSAPEGFVYEPARGEVESEQFVEQLLENEQQAVMEYLHQGHPVQEQFRQKYFDQIHPGREQSHQEYLSQKQSHQEHLNQEHLNQEQSHQEHPSQKHPSQEHPSQEHPSQEHLSQEQSHQEYPGREQFCSTDFVEQEETGHVFIETFPRKEYTEKGAVKPETWFSFVEKLHRGSSLEEEFYSYFQKNEESFPHSEAGNEEDEENKKGKVEEDKKENKEKTHGYLALKNEFFRLVEDSKEPEELEQIWNLADLDYVLKESAREWKNSETETLSEKKELLKEWIGYMDGVSWERFLILLSTKKELEKLTEKSFQYGWLVKTGIEEKTVSEPADRGEPAAVQIVPQGSVYEPAGHRGLESEPFSGPFVEQILENEQRAVVEYLRHAHRDQEQSRQEYLRQGHPVWEQPRQEYFHQGHPVWEQSRQEYFRNTDYGKQTAMPQFSTEEHRVREERPADRAGDRPEYKTEGRTGYQAEDRTGYREEGRARYQAEDKAEHKIEYTNNRGFSEEWIAPNDLNPEKTLLNLNTWLSFVDKVHQESSLMQEFYRQIQEVKTKAASYAERNREGITGPEEPFQSFAKEPSGQDGLLYFLENLSYEEAEQIYNQIDVKKIFGGGKRDETIFNGKEPDEKGTGGREPAPVDQSGIMIQAGLLETEQRTESEVFLVQLLQKSLYEKEKDKIQERKMLWSTTATALYQDASLAHQAETLQIPKWSEWEFPDTKIQMDFARGGAGIREDGNGQNRENKSGQNRENVYEYRLLRLLKQMNEGELAHLYELQKTVMAAQAVSKMLTVLKSDTISYSRREALWGAIADAVYQNPDLKEKMEKESHIKGQEFQMEEQKNGGYRESETVYLRTADSAGIRSSADEVLALLKNLSSETLSSGTAPSGTASLGTPSSETTFSETASPGTTSSGTLSSETASSDTVFSETAFSDIASSERVFPETAFSDIASSERVFSEIESPDTVFSDTVSSEAGQRYTAVTPVWDIIIAKNGGAKNGGRILAGMAGEGSPVSRWIPEQLLRAEDESREIPDYGPVSLVPGNPGRQAVSDIVRTPQVSADIETRIEKTVKEQVKDINFISRRDGESSVSKAYETKIETLSDQIALQRQEIEEIKNGSAKLAQNADVHKIANTVMKQLQDQLRAERLRKGF